METLQAADGGSRCSRPSCSWSGCFGRRPGVDGMAVAAGRAAPGRRSAPGSTGARPAHHARRRGGCAPLPRPRWSSRGLAVGSPCRRVGAGGRGVAPRPPRRACGWEPYSAERRGRAARPGRPVFVDFTAAWCLTCQVNERVALEHADGAASASRAHGVALLKADWTLRDDRHHARRSRATAARACRSTCSTAASASAPPRAAARGADARDRAGRARRDAGHAGRRRVRPTLTAKPRMTR